ncbi:MAG: DUF1801 domain-containing protein [Ahniella sp.]|nr:DUF1801 domain-containing protein [Ahniella sp.]
MALKKADTSEAVNVFMAALTHPDKTLIQAIRSTVLACDPDVREGIKWNAPSYRTHEYFATTNLREKSGVGMILHLGAKVRAMPAGSLVIDDSDRLLRWLAVDRASVVFKDLAEFEAHREAFVLILRQWIQHL